MDPQRVSRAAVALAEGRARIRPGPEPGTFEVGSLSGSETYTVRLTPERSCTCPDARFHKVRTCKHVALVLLSEGP